MAGLLNIFSGKSEEKAVQSTLAQLDRQKTIVRLEIEKTQTRFNTVLAMRKGAVVVAKPNGIDQFLKAGTMVRFKVPGEKHDIRMEISTPHLNLGNGSPVFLCTAPTRFSATSHRGSERFSTKRFSNVSLHIDSLGSKFSIEDLSESGCRIKTNHTKPQVQFPLSENIQGAFIQLGNKARIDLTQVTPRSYQGQNVGLEFQIRSDGPHRKLLGSMVDSLARQQREMLRASHI